MLTLARGSAAHGAGPNIAHGHEADAPPSFLGSRVGIRGVLEIDGELVISGLVKGRIAAKSWSLPQAAWSKAISSRAKS